MSTARLAVRQLRYEHTVFRRTPAAVFFTVAFPVLLLVIFGTLNRHERLDAVGGIAFTQYYVPAMAAFGIMSACFANLAGRFVYRRELGMLKRLRATPLPLGALIGGFVANAVAVGTLVTAVNVGVGVAFFGVTVPERWAALALVLVVGSAAFCAMGIAASVVIPSVDAADPMIFGTFMPLVFVSGVFFPIDPGSLLARLAALFPVRHLVEAAFAAFDPRHGGSGVAWADLAVVAAWGLAAAGFAATRFRWEPSRS